MPKSSKEVITLGSGKLYYLPFDGSTVPDIDTMCVETNRIGWIKGGASIEYTPTYYVAKDDLGMVNKSVITEEEAIFKTGIMTFNGTTLKTLIDTGRVAEDQTNHRRTLKIGGIDNASGQNYVLVFHHQDDVDGDKWVRVIGRNQAGFTLSFQKDTETVVDAEFRCQPGLDNQGTLIEFIEELDAE